MTLVEGILAQGRRHGRKNVNVSVGSFVPKSWTPFQWAPFDGVEVLERKLAYLKDRFRRVVAFLARRGYAGSEVRRVVREALQP